ncbi:MAG TPA: APC family permease [Solirubrobacteraceae bacterium]|nr:APC family permease [Solirubrobacteraceae bacterium]
MTPTPEQPAPHPAKPGARSPAGAKATLTWLAMAMLTLGSVGDLGATPATAVLGLASVVIYVLPAIVFLLPASLVSAELASGWPGGVYNWVSEGISPRMGFVAIWCQFAQTTFYYPALLAYVASTLAYVFAPSLAHSGVYTTVVIIVLFWSAVLVSARGVLSTGRLASYGIFIGTLIPGLLLVLLAAIYLLQGNAAAAPLNAHHVLPPWHGLTSVVLIVNSFFLYAGVEVNAVHVDELRDAPREFPKATLVAVVLILLVFVLPTLAISVAVPAPHISFTAGVMQAFKTLLEHFGLNVLTPIIAVGLVVASLSGLLDWLTGPSTGLLDIARERGYLPRYFQELNSNGVQLHILIAQGAVITLIGLLYALLPAVSRAYWVFAALATEVYLIMYVLMFVAAINLRRRQPEHPRGYRAPALLAICLLGTLASVAACVVGLLPPSQLGHITTLPYLAALLAATLLVGLLPPLLLHKLRRSDWKAAA